MGNIQDGGSENEESNVEEVQQTKVSHIFKKKRSRREWSTLTPEGKRKRLSRDKQRVLLPAAKVVLGTFMTDVESRVGYDEVSAM